ncbi:hypothetical protein DEMA109039_05255 [Deinococcus marmoris]
MSGGLRVKGVEGLRFLAPSPVRGKLGEGATGQAAIVNKFPRPLHV